jgi:hypothetical protein
MKNQLTILVIIIIFLFVGLSGCTNNSLNSDSKKFVGTWIDSRFPDESFIFLSNNSGTWTDVSMLWEIKDGKLVITLQLTSSESENIYDYTFSNNDKTLTLTYVRNPQVSLDLIKQ